MGFGIHTLLFFYLYVESELLDVTHENVLVELYMLVFFFSYDNWWEFSIYFMALLLPPLTYRQCWSPPFFGGEFAALSRAMTVFSGWGVLLGVRSFHLPTSVTFWSNICTGGDIASRQENGLSSGTRMTSIKELTEWLVFGWSWVVGIRFLPYTMSLFFVAYSHKKQVPVFPEYSRLTQQIG